MQELHTKESDSARASSRGKRSESFRLTRNHVNQFLVELKRTDHTEKTIESYRRNILSFYEFLGPKKDITPDSLLSWQTALEESGYSGNSVKSRLSAVNSLFGFLGIRNYQIPVGKHAQPQRGAELTREEYLQLLLGARERENIQLYLLIKVLATTDLTPSDIVLLTREAVNEGVVTGKKQGADGPVVLPPALREELLEYARLWGLRTGPIFLNGDRKPYDRTAITRMIVLLASDMGIEAGKANPRNLRRMHLSTQEAFQKEAQAWVKAQYQNLLAEEESRIGWRVRSDRIHAETE